MTKIPKDAKPFTSIPESEEEIDLGQVFKCFRRKYRLISCITLASSLFSVVNAITQPSVWEGRFQIVLENKQISGSSGLSGLASGSGAGNPLLSSLASGAGPLTSTIQSSLKTEVKVLQSPSVLKPVFEYIKTEKAKDGANVSTWNYSSWAKRSLNVVLEDQTSVLNISYIDTNKDLIIPVLNLISEAYQEYSGRDRLRNLNQNFSYLESQLSTLRDQSTESMKAATAHSLKHSLSLKDGLPSLTYSEAGQQLGGEVTLEVRRQQIKNKINMLSEQLAVMKSPVEGRNYMSAIFEDNDELFVKLQELESRLAQKSALLLPSDTSIRALQREISNLKQYINRQSIGLIEGQIKNAEAELASVSRPDDVMLMHRELVRRAYRDELTLTQIESQLQSLRLAKARKTTPWELISKPALLGSPIAPKKRQIVGIGFLVGLVTGSAVALVAERLSGLVFSLEELKGQLPGPLLKHLSSTEQKSWTSEITLLAKGPLDVDDSGAIGIIPVGNVQKLQVEKFADLLRQCQKKREVIITTDLVQSINCATQLLITSPGVATRAQLTQLNERLTLQGTHIAGWVFLDPDLKL